MTNKHKASLRSAHPFETRWLIQPTSSSCQKIAVPEDLPLLVTVHDGFVMPALTAETITESHIRVLRDRACTCWDENGNRPSITDPEGHATIHDCDIETYVTCVVALEGTGEEQHAARERCAEIVNDRRGTKLEFFNPTEISREKDLSRQLDALAIQTGAKSVAQLRTENAAFAFKPVRLKPPTSER